MQVTEHNGCVGCSYEDRNCHEEPCFSCYGTKLRDNYKRATNADRIRKMSDEELADFLENIFRDCSMNVLFSVSDEECNSYTDCKSCRQAHKTVVEWLQSEAEEST